MTSVSKNVYIHKLHDIVNEYNNTYKKQSKLNLFIVGQIYIYIY